MRFALLGNHPDGMAFARALTNSGHELVAIHDVSASELPVSAPVVTDLESLLADPQIEAVIVAGPLAGRFEQMRRAIQSERTVYCVFPCDDKLDRAYEAGWMQSETRHPLIPLLPDALHPAFAKMTAMLATTGRMTLLKWELIRARTAGVTFRGWDILRTLGGEIIEVSGSALTSTVKPEEPLLFQGKFEKGGLIQVIALPTGSARDRLTIAGPDFSLELEGPDSIGAATLRIQSAKGESSEQTWPSWDRWSELARNPELVSWQDAIRAMELDDALIRSIEKRRASELEYGDVTEDVAGKGKVTLIGCGMIWMILVVFGLSVWVPMIRWAIVPMILGFFALVILQQAGRKR